MRKIIYLFILILMGSCSTEEPFHGRPYPKVETLTPSYSGNQVIFHGKITYKRDVIIDHGFRWTKNGDPINGVYQSISFGSYSTDEFLHTIPNPARCGSCDDYFKVRAFVQSADYTYYGPALYY